MATTSAPVRIIAVTPFRVIAVVHAVLLCAQPALIGQFLNGAYPRLEDHEFVGSMALLACVAQVPAALLAWLVGRFPGWPVAVTLAMFFGEGIQMGAGYERNLALHVPLGVALVVLGCLVAGWAWLPRRAAGR